MQEVIFNPIIDRLPSGPLKVNEKMSFTIRVRCDFLVEKVNSRPPRKTELAFILNFNINVAFVVMFVLNLISHALIDNMKANQHSINLIDDQILHMVQIIFTWWVMISYM